MATLRFQALTDLLKKTPKHVSLPGTRVSDYYGELVFSDTVMVHYLSRDIYQQVKESVVKGEPIDRKIADGVAAGMKAWAISKGATHYTHWFQP